MPSFLSDIHSVQNFILIHKPVSKGKYRWTLQILPTVKQLLEKATDKINRKQTKNDKKVNPIRLQIQRNTPGIRLVPCSPIAMSRLRNGIFTDKGNITLLYMNFFHNMWY